MTHFNALPQIDENETIEDLYMPITHPLEILYRYS